MSHLTQATPASRPVLARSGANYAVEFNNQFLFAPVPPGLEGAANWTFALWFKRLGAWAEFNSNAPIFQLTVSGGSTTTGAGISRHQEEFIAATSDQTGGQSATRPRVDDSVAPIGEWVHLAGTRSSNGTGRFFVNGVQADSRSPLEALGSDLSNHRVSIGASWGGSRAIRMAASNLQIWNIALTEQQIADWAMKRLTGELPSGLLFYAPL